MRNSIYVLFFFLFISLPKYLFSQAPIVWDNLVGVEVSSNNSLVKTDENKNGWCIDGASSKNYLDHGKDGWAEFKVSNTNNALEQASFGFSEIINGNSCLQYSFVLDGSQMSAYVNGGYYTYLGYYQDGDVLRINRDINGTFGFYQNGNLLVSTYGPLDSKLFVTASLINQGDKINEAVTSENFSKVVKWTNLVGSQENSNNLVKIDENWTDRCIDGASSSHYLPQNTAGWAEFIASYSNGSPESVTFGFSELNVSNGTSCLQFAFNLETSSQLSAYVDGKLYTYFGNYQAGDVLRIGRDENGAIGFYQNGNMLTLVSGSLGTKLFVVASLSYKGDMINGAMLSGSFTVPNNVKWTNLSGVVVTSENNLVMNDPNPVDLCVDGASSSNYLPSGKGGWAEFTASFNLGNYESFSFGLSSPSNLSNDISCLQYALKFDNGGGVGIYYKGSYWGTISNYSEGDVFRIERRITDGLIIFYKNGQLITYLKPEEYGSLIIQCSFYGTLGDRINNTTLSDNFISKQDSVLFQWTDTIGVLVDVQNNLLKLSYNPYWSGAASVNKLPPDSLGWAEFTINKIDQCAAFGFSYSNLDETYSKMDFAFLQQFDNLLIIQNGNIVGSFGNIIVGDILKLEKVDDRINFYKNYELMTSMNYVKGNSFIIDVSLFKTPGVLLMPSLSSAFFQPSIKIPLEWHNGIGVDINNNTITSTVSSFGNSGASSLNVLDKNQDGWFEFVANNSNDILAIGFSQLDVDADLNSIEYAILLNEGSCSVYRKGELQGNFGSVSSGDKFRIARTGNRMEFFKNDYELMSLDCSNYPFIVDASISSLGSFINGYASFKPRHFFSINTTNLQTSGEDNVFYNLDNFTQSYPIGSVNVFESTDAVEALTFHQLFFPGNEFRDSSIISFNVHGGRIISDIYEIKTLAGIRDSVPLDTNYYSIYNGENLVLYGDNKNSQTATQQLVWANLENGILLSPNSDNYYDLLTIGGINNITNYNLKIYDLSGNIVFQTSDKNQSWNGKFMNIGALVPAGTYKYSIDADGNNVSSQFLVEY